MAVTSDQRSGDSSVETKTFKVNKVEKLTEQNVLNKYRTSTYNFTLAAVRKTAVNDPLSYRKKLDLVILKSGGKGFEGLSNNVEEVTRQVTDRIVASELGDYAVKKTVNDSKTGKALVESFNKNSPGRFDMFIENVEIESMLGFSELGGTTLPTSLRFDVIEPYSINGFIEALHTAAVAAGYLNYAQASFVLKMEFIGYPDSKDLTSPEIIPKSTRYFLFTFTGLQVEVTERGTRYRCAAVPFNEKPFGELTTIQSSISMRGDNVQEILKDLLNSLNAQIVKADKDSKTGSSANAHDTYDIVFPVLDKSKPGGLDFDNVNDIGKAKVVDIARDNQLFAFNDQGSTDKRVAYQIKDNKGSSEPLNSKDSKPRIQFREGAKIHEIIASVIRDSTYVRELIASMGKGKIPNEYGNVPYFAVKLEVTNKATTDLVSRKVSQNYRFVVVPYNVHFTRVPGYQSAKFDTTKIKSIIIKEYNYIYTGQNVDVLNFKLNFNNLFFEAVPRALGNNDIPSVESSSGKTEDTTVKYNPDDPKKIEASGVPISNLLPSSQFTKIQQVGGNAGQLQDDPYFALARSMHAAIIDSKTAMLSGDIEILGDPFFLVQGGIGNYNPEEEVKGKTKDGDANHQYGEVLVNINFRNPVDITPFDQGGKLYFDPNTVPFSGIYRVNKVHSTFTDGIFKQRLTILRMPGQIIDNTQATNVGDKQSTETKPDSNTSQITNPETGTS